MAAGPDEGGPAHWDEGEESHGCPPENWRGHAQYPKRQPAQDPLNDRNQYPPVDCGSDHLFESLNNQFALSCRKRESFFKTFQEAISIFEEVVKGEKREEEACDKGRDGL